MSPRVKGSRKKFTANSKPPMIPDYASISLTEAQLSGIQQDIEEMWPPEVNKMPKEDVMGLLSKLSQQEITDEVYLEYFSQNNYAM